MQFFLQKTLILGALALFNSPVAAVADPTPSLLEQILTRGYLNCGVGSGMTLVKIDEATNRRGFFSEYCHVLGSALFGNSEAVKYIEVDGTTRFKALQTGAIDVLMSNTTRTLSRDAKLGLDFTTPLFYDGQGFLAYKNLGATSLSDLTTARVCANKNTTSLDNIKDLVQTTKPGLKIIESETNDAIYSNFSHRRCDVMTDDRLSLLTTRLLRMPNPDDLVIFTDVISKEPLGPAIKQGDSRWFDVVQWSLFATLAAEELALSSKNIQQKLDSKLPLTAQRLLGLTGSFGPDLGLPQDWALNIITQVGNYDEIYVRYFGAETKRGINALWSQGGLMYVPPFR